MTLHLTSVRDSNVPVAPPAPLTPFEIETYLDYLLDSLINRREKVVEALRRTAEAMPEIQDDEQLETATDNMRIANALLKTAEDNREKSKKPYLEGGRVVDAWFKKFGAPVITARQPLQSAMDAYGAKKLAEVQAETARLRKLMQDEADRAAAAAAKAMAADSLDAEAKLEETAQAALAAEKADAHAFRSPAAATRSRTAMGAVASVRVKWKPVVIDINLVPDRFIIKSVNAIAVMEEAAKRTDPITRKPLAVIPGIKWVQETKMGIT